MMNTVIRKRAALFTALCFLLLFTVPADLKSQHTFSIVAIDSVTGEIGSAGATCLDGSFGGGAVIISDIVPGVGAVHTQAFWNPGNQQNARARLEAGDDATQIKNWLISNDVQGDPSLRQYGIVTIDAAGQISVDAYTGANTDDYKNHIVGPDYAIQGNILLGQSILDSMEARFLNTQGSLADRLMAAMQGANVPGADTRCLSSGVSSFTSFLRVSRASDVGGFYYLDLRITSTPPNGVDPIDALQSLYDAWSPPDCHILIESTPQPVIISDTSVLSNVSGQTYIVCEGASLSMTSAVNNTVHLVGANSFCQIGQLSVGNQVYVGHGAGYDGTGSIGNIVFADPGSDVVYAGDGASVTLCDSVTWINLEDFNSCESKLSVSKSTPVQINFRYIHPDILDVAWSERVRMKSIFLSNVSGQVLASYPPEPSGLLRIDLSSFPMGMYLLHFHSESGGYQIRKIVKL